MMREKKRMKNFEINRPQRTYRNSSEKERVSEERERERERERDGD